MKSNFKKENSVIENLDVSIEAVKLNDSYCVVKHEITKTITKNGKTLAPEVLKSQYVAKNEDIFNAKGKIRNITEFKPVSSLKDSKTKQPLRPLLTTVNIEQFQEDFLSSKEKMESDMNKGKEVFDFYEENKDAKLYFSLWLYNHVLLDENLNFYLKVTDGGNMYFLDNKEYDLKKLMEMAKKEPNICLIEDEIESVPSYNSDFSGHKYINAIFLITDKTFGYWVDTFNGVSPYLKTKYKLSDYELSEAEKEEVEHKIEENYNTCYC